MSYSLCQVCSPLCPGNGQVCWRVSHCAKEWETMGGIVDRHSDWASSDKVSEKWWWSYKRQRHDWKCAATVVVQHTSLCCNSWCHDITSWKASNYHLFSMWSSERQGICMTCETWTHVSIGLIHMIHLMAVSLRFVLYPAGWQQVRVMHGIKCDETEKVVSEIQGSFENVYVRNATIKETSDGAHPKWVAAGVKVDKAKFVQIDHYILFLRCTALAQRENEDVTSYFAHGMTAVPTSLFTHFFLRKVDKSEIGREIKTNMRNIMSDYATKLTPYSMLVIDGGSLLHFMRW